MEPSGGGCVQRQAARGGIPSSRCCCDGGGARVKRAAGVEQRASDKGKGNAASGQRSEAASPPRRGEAPQLQPSGGGAGRRWSGGGRPARRPALRGGVISTMRIVQRPPGGLPAAGDLTNGGGTFALPDWTPAETGTGAIEGKRMKWRRPVRKFGRPVAGWRGDACLAPCPAFSGQVWLTGGGGRTKYRTHGLANTATGTLGRPCGKTGALTAGNGRTEHCDCELQSTWPLSELRNHKRQAGGGGQPSVVVAPQLRGSAVRLRPRKLFLLPAAAAAGTAAVVAWRRPHGRRQAAARLAAGLPAAAVSCRRRLGLGVAAAAAAVVPQVLLQRLLRPLHLPHVVVDALGCGTAWQYMQCR